MRRRINALVLVLVLVLVAGLLATYLPRVREAAARSDCRNNLRQIGMAMRGYHDTFHSFPSATIPNEGLPPERRLSWLVDTLPYMDQINLTIDRNKAWDAEENREPSHRREDGLVGGPLGELRLFRCSSNPGKAASGNPGLTHYVGIAGTGPDAAALPGDYPGAGVFRYDRGTRLADIRDGAGTTMMVAETTSANGPWTAGGHSTVRGLDPVGGPYLGPSGQVGSNHRRGGNVFASAAPYATNVLFADGSVRSLVDSLDPEVLEALASFHRSPRQADLLRLAKDAFPDDKDIQALKNE